MYCSLINQTPTVKTTRHTILTFLIEPTSMDPCSIKSSKATSEKEMEKRPWPVKQPHGYLLKSIGPQTSFNHSGRTGCRPTPFSLLICLHPVILAADCTYKICNDVPGFAHCIQMRDTNKEISGALLAPLKMEPTTPPQIKTRIQA